MNLRIIIIFLLATFSPNIKGQKLFLIGSRLISTNSPYKVFISAQKLNQNSIVNVTFEAGDNHVKSKLYKNLPADSFFEEIQFEIPDTAQHNYKISIAHSSLGRQKCNEESLDLIDITKRPIVFIQMSQSAFNTVDEIKFRIFSLTQNLLPLNFENMIVTIYDSQENIIEIFNNAIHNQFGLYENTLKIAESSNLGKWKIHVDIDGYKKSQYFHIQKKDELQVSLQVENVVAYENHLMEMKLFVKNPNDEFFFGTANISAKGYFVGETNQLFDIVAKEVNVTNGKNLLDIHFQNDMNIQMPMKDMLIKLDIKIVESVTGKMGKVEAETKMLHKGKYNISFVKSEHFRPGVKFPMKIRIRHLDGRPDNSFNSLNLLIDYINFDSRNSAPESIKKNFKINLKNGDANFPLMPDTNTKKIIVNLEFGETKKTEVIEAVPDFENSEYIQIVLAKKAKKVGDVIKVQVESNKEMEALHVMVISRQGVVYNRDYPEAKTLDIFNFTIEATEQMAPESTAFVYYMNKNTGSLIHETFPINLGLTIENSLTVETVENAKPNDTINIHFHLEKESMVFVKAIEIDAEKDENDITTTLLLEEIVRYKNLGFEDLSEFKFGKYNGFVMQPLNSKEVCGFRRSSSNEKFKDLDTEQKTKTSTEFYNQKFIPDVWFYDSFIALHDTEIERNLPNRPTSWKFHSISMHPKKGLIVDFNDPKINVLAEFAIKIYSPKSFGKYKVFEVKYGIFNYLRQEVAISVSISIENGQMMNGTDCSYKPTAINNPNSLVTIPSRSMSDIKSFFVQTNEKPVKVKVSAKSSSQKFDEERTIKIQENEHEHEQPIKSSPEFQHDLIGPALDGFDTIFTSKYEYDEYKMNKFKVAIISYRYLKESRIKSPAEALERVKTGYQEAIFLLNDILQRKKPQNLKITAQIVQNLIDAKELIAIDDAYINDSLKYISEKQERDGSFFDENIDNQNGNIECSEKQKVIMTALTISTFLKEENIKLRYRNEISKAINFIKAGQSCFHHDYDKVVVAYVLALNRDFFFSKEVINSIKKSFKAPKTYSKNYAIYVKVASYLIMTNILNGVDYEQYVDWLLAERNNQGSYYSPYDTSLAIQALYEFYKSNRIAINNIPSNNLTHTVIAFNVTTEVKKLDTKNFEIKIISNIFDKTIGIINLAIIEISLPSGYKLSSYEKTHHTENVETKNDGKFVIIYIKNIEMTSDSYTQTVNIEKINEACDLENMEVKIYDYYQPNVKSISYLLEIEETNIETIEEKKKGNIFSNFFAALG